MKKIAIFLLFCGLVFACGQRRDVEKSVFNDDKSGLLEGDSTVYGLACEGCNDSVVVLLPADGSDPVTYNVVEARRNQKVHGQMRIGDWIGLVRNPKDSAVADLVVDLDELKGTWCYVVMPQLRGHAEMSKAEHAARLREMPDSVKNEFFIPREYGFTLKRQWTAQSVGYVPEQKAVEDKSPVVYPRLLFFTGWHILNGRLIVTSGEFGKDDDSSEMKIVSTRNDTCDILYLRGDSLVLGSDGATRSYYRRSNKDEINKEAREKAEKRLKESLGL